MSIFDVVVCYLYAAEECNLFSHTFCCSVFFIGESSINNYFLHCGYVFLSLVNKEAAWTIDKQDDIRAKLRMIGRRRVESGAASQTQREQR